MWSVGVMLRPQACIPAQFSTLRARSKEGWLPKIGHREATSKVGRLSKISHRNATSKEGRILSLGVRKATSKEGGHRKSTIAKQQARKVGYQMQVFAWVLLSCSIDVNKRRWFEWICRLVMHHSRFKCTRLYVCMTGARVAVETDQYGWIGK